MSVASHATTARSDEPTDQDDDHARLLRRDSSARDAEDSEGDGERPWQAEDSASRISESAGAVPAEDSSAGQRRTLLDMNSYQWLILGAAWLGWGFDM